MNTITELAPDFYRISTYVPEANLLFNQFVINDNEPLLFHTGLRSLYPSSPRCCCHHFRPGAVKVDCF